MQLLIKTLYCHFQKKKNPLLPPFDKSPYRQGAGQTQYNLDGVGHIDNKPSTNKLYHLKKNNLYPLPSLLLPELSQGKAWARQTTWDTRNNHGAYSNLGPKPVRMVSEVQDRVVVLLLLQSTFLLQLCFFFFFTTHQSAYDSRY